MNRVLWLSLCLLVPSGTYAEQENESSTESASSESSSRTLVWPDGTKYVGEVRDDKRWGKGTIFWPDGTRFVGNFVNDKRHGPGSMILPDGTVYNGFFQDDNLVEAPPASEPGIPRVAEADVKAALEATADSTPEQPPSGQLESMPKAEETSSSPAQPLVTEKRKPTLSDATKNELIVAIDGWARAWSDQDVESYLTFYDTEFQVPGRQTRSQWEGLRKSRISRPGSIDVTVVYESFIMLSEDIINVVFTQTYKSDIYQDKTRKQLTMRSGEKGWKILKEQSL